MKAGAGKRKGGAFERLVGRMLSLWLTSGKDKTQFVRSSLSGGWAPGKAGQAPWRHLGDLAPNGDVGDAFRKRFVIECKHHRVVNAWELWTTIAGRLPKWWRQVTKEAKTVEGLQPLLVFRGNFMPVMVGVTLDTYPLLEGAEAVGVFPWLDLVILPLEDMLRCAPERFLADITADS